MDLPKAELNWTPGRTMAARHRLELAYLRELRRLSRGLNPELVRWEDLGLSYAQVKQVMDENEELTEYELARELTKALTGQVRTHATYDYNRTQWDAIPDGFSKRWVAHHDDRVRPAHLALDGTTVKKWQPFHSGPFALQYPGDPSGPPELVRNCRCIIVPVPPPNITASAFAFNPDQWRNPKNGQWVDMPWTLLSKMFKEINAMFPVAVRVPGQEWPHRGEVAVSPPSVSPQNAAWFANVRQLYKTIATWRRADDLRTGDLAVGTRDLLPTLENLERLAPDVYWRMADTGQDEPVAHASRDLNEYVSNAIRDTRHKLEKLADQLEFTDDPVREDDLPPAEDLDIPYEMVEQARNVIRRFYQAGLDDLDQFAVEDFEQVITKIPALVQDQSPDRNKKINDFLAEMSLTTRAFGPELSSHPELMMEITMTMMWLQSVRDLGALLKGEPTIDTALRDELDEYTKTFPLNRREDIGSWVGDNRGLTMLERGEPISARQAAEDANIGRYRVNCQKAVLAYEAQRRGYVDALAGSQTGGVLRIKVNDPDGKDLKTYANMASAAFGPEGAARAIFPEMYRLDGEEILGLISTWPPGARGFLVIGWMSGSAHVVAIEVTDNKVIVVDPQVVQFMELGDYLYQPMQLLSAFRVDDLEMVNGRFVADEVDNGLVQHVYGSHFVHQVRELLKAPDQYVPRVGNQDRRPAVRDDDEGKVGVGYSYRELEGRTDGRHVLDGNPSSREVVGGPRHRYSSRFIQGQHDLSVELTFAFNPDQWRNPLNGQWIDMPWTMLAGLFKQINLTQDFYADGKHVDGLPAPEEEEWYSTLKKLYHMSANWRRNPELTTEDLGDGADAVLAHLGALRDLAPTLKFWSPQKGGVLDSSSSAMRRLEIQAALDAATEKFTRLSDDLWSLPFADFHPFTDEPPVSLSAGKRQLGKDRARELLGWSPKLKSTNLRDDLVDVADYVENAGGLADNDELSWAFASEAIGAIDSLVIQLTAKGDYDDMIKELREARSWINALRDTAKSPSQTEFKGVQTSYMGDWPSLDSFTRDPEAIGSWTDIERGLMALEKGDPVPIEEAAMLANVGEYNINCQKAVLAYEAMRRGYADAIAGGTQGGGMSAAGLGASPTTAHVTMSGTTYGPIGMFRELWSREGWSELERYIDGNTQDQVTQLKMITDGWPVGARGQLVVTWSTSSAHIVALEKLADDKVLVVDPQIHKMMPVENYLSFVASVVSVMRTDDLEMIGGSFLGEDMVKGAISEGSRTASVLRQLIDGDITEKGVQATFASRVQLAVKLRETLNQIVGRVGDGENVTVVKDHDKRKVQVRFAGRKLEREPNGAHVLGQYLDLPEVGADEVRGDGPGFVSGHHDLSVGRGQAFKYNPAQLRIPAGNELGGRWMDSPFSLISALVNAYSERTGIGTDLLNYDWPEPQMRPLQDGDAAILAEKYGIKVSPTWFDVEVDLEGKGGRIIKAKYKDTQGRIKPKYVYSAEQTKIQDAVKYNRVKALADRIDTLKAGLEKIDGDHTVAATRLMFLYGVRVGSSDDEKAKVKAYGTTTLRMEHLSKNADGTMQLNFIAKKGVPASYLVDDPELVAFLEDRLNSGDSPGSFVFNTTDTKTQDKIREITGVAQAKNHDLRTLLANYLAVQEGLKAEPPADKKQFNALRTAIATKVAEALHNKPVEAQKSYITPAVFELIEWDTPSPKETS